jgi:hypothetical protein
MKAPVLEDVPICPSSPYDLHNDCAIGYIIPPPLEVALGINGDNMKSAIIKPYVSPSVVLPNFDMKK